MILNDIYRFVNQRVREESKADNRENGLLEYVGGGSERLVAFAEYFFSRIDPETPEGRSALDEMDPAQLGRLFATLLDKTAKARAAIGFGRDDGRLFELLEGMDDE